jgi:L-fuculose-phosphate aldolase
VIRRSHRASRSAWKARREILAGADELVKSGLVVGTLGNISRRCRGDVLITPSRLPYQQLHPWDLVLTDLAGRVLRGRHRESTETPLHLAVYRRRPDLLALVHTHSPYATAWSYLARPLCPTVKANFYYEVGPVNTSSVWPTGTAGLCESTVEALADSRAVLIGEHGVLAGGNTVSEAVSIAKVVEHEAQVAWLLRQHGTGTTTKERQSGTESCAPQAIPEY